MFDLGWTEILVIGVVALIVVGPKDLPVLFRNVGRFVGKAKGMAREFTRAMEDAAEKSGVRDIQKSFKTASNPMGAAVDSVREAARDVTRAFEAPDTTGRESEAEADSETAKLSAERAEAARKIQAASARAAAERKAKEAAEALAQAEKYEAELSQGPGSDTESKA